MKDPYIIQTDASDTVSFKLQSRTAVEAEELLQRLFLIMLTGGEAVNRAESSGSILEFVKGANCLPDSALETAAKTLINVAVQLLDEDTRKLIASIDTRAADGRVLYELTLTDGTSTTGGMNLNDL